MREIVKDKGGDRAITSREEGQRVLGIHTRGIPSGCSPSISSSSPARVSAEVWRWRREWKTAQCAHKARETVTPSRSPLPVPPPRSNRNPGGAPSSLFLASRACENSCTQAAFRPAPASDPAFVDVRGNAPYTARIIRD